MNNFVISKGGTKAYKLLSDNILIPSGNIYPPIELTSKIVESHHIDAFTKGDLDELKKEFGYYTDLQSENSEDSITWSYFGYISKFCLDIKLKFLNSLIEKINSKDVNKFDEQSECEIVLWHRFAHPQKPSSSNGPELDALIIGSSIMFLIECKWNSGIGAGQGINHDLDQLEIRKMWIERFKKKIYPSLQKEVLLVVRKKHLKKYISSGNIILTWEELSMLNIPHKKEFQEYISNK